MIEESKHVGLRSPEMARLLLSHHETTSKVDGFTLPGVGGGYILLNLYGDYPLSICSVNFGLKASAPLPSEKARPVSRTPTWEDDDQIFEWLTKTANTISDKCNVADLRIGGGAIVIYFEKQQFDAPTYRRRLLEKLARTLLPSLTQTRVLCIPGMHCSLQDMVFLHQGHQQATPPAKLASSSSLEGNNERDSATPASPDGHRRRRSNSLSRVDYDFEFPVPSGMISTDAIQNKILVKAASLSAYGAIRTLTKAKNWAIPRIVIAGYTETSHDLFWKLVSDNDDVLFSNPDLSVFQNSAVGESKRIHWDQVLSTQCDVLVLADQPLSAECFCPVLNESLVESLNCRAILSLHDDRMPIDSVERERVHIILERRGIFEFAEGLADVGALFRGHALASKATVDSPERSLVELGSHVMKKRLHLDFIVKEYDTDDKRKFYSMIFADEVEEIGGLKLGIGTILDYSSDEMTEFMWTRARALSPAYHKSIIDLGAGNGAAARWICKQDPRIHVKCINITASQNLENRQLSDEEGLGGRISVETMSFENLPPEFTCQYDGAISQDSFVHAYSKFQALSEAFRVTKGGGWLMVSDLVLGSDDDGSNEEILSFAEKNNVRNWVTAAGYLDLASNAGWSEVRFTDCTSQIKASLQSILDRIRSIISSRTHTGLNLKLLQTHRLALTNRIGQIDRGIFMWGIISARKPYEVVFKSVPPAIPDRHPMMSYVTDATQGTIHFGTDVVVLNISDRMKQQDILQLPATVRLLVTMSAGLDHIDLEAAANRGLLVRRAARFQIVKSVADFLLSNIILGTLSACLDSTR
jgi:SAM-dependent methyltransferase